MIANIKASSKLSVFLSADSFIFIEKPQLESGEIRTSKQFLSELKPLVDWKSKDLFDHFWKHDILPTKQLEIEVTLGDIPHSWLPRKHETKLSKEALTFERISSIESNIQYQVPTAINHFFGEIRNARISFQLLNAKLIQSLIVKEISDFVLYYKLHETVYVVCLHNGRIEISNFFRVASSMDVIYYFKLIQKYVSALGSETKQIVGGELENHETLIRLSADILGNHGKLSSYFTKQGTKAISPFDI